MPVMAPVVIVITELRELSLELTRAREIVSCGLYNPQFIFLVEMALMRDRISKLFFITTLSENCSLLGTDNVCKLKGAPNPKMDQTVCLNLVK